MGKHNTIAFKLQVLQPILKGKMSIREAVPFTISRLKQSTLIMVTDGFTLVYQVSIIRKSNV